MKSIPSFIIAFLLLLQACTVSKDIKIEAVPVPQQYRNGVSNDSQSIATIAWKQFFNDPYLQRLIDTAIAGNFDRQIALKNIESAGLLLRQSKLGNLPDLRLQANASINRPSDNSLTGLSLNQFLGKTYIEDYTLAAALSWEADIWGKIRNQKKKSLAAYLQTGEAVKAIQTSLVAMIAEGYYNLLMLDEQLRIASKNVALNDSTLQIIRLQFAAGQVTVLAVQQAEAQRLVAVKFIPLLEQEISLQENALRVLSGITPSSIPRGRQLADIEFPALLSAGVPAALLENRPDIKSKEYELNIANANAAIAKANLYPSFTITAAGGINSFIASNWFTIPASLFGTVAGGLTQPVFQRKQLRTKYKVALIDREMQVLSFRQSVLKAVGEVSDALVKVEKLKEQQEIAHVRVDTLQKAIGQADLLFRNGMASYLEVITAQSNVLSGELESVNLRKLQLSAVVELYRSLGGGWR